MNVWDTNVSTVVTKLKKVFNFHFANCQGNLMVDRLSKATIFFAADT